jgi:hypothetical protein
MSHFNIKKRGKEREKEERNLEIPSNYVYRPWPEDKLSLTVKEDKQGDRAAITHKPKRT